MPDNICIPWRIQVLVYGIRKQPVSRIVPEERTWTAPWERLRSLPYSEHGVLQKPLYVWTKLSSISCWLFIKDLPPECTETGKPSQSPWPQFSREAFVRVCQLVCCCLQGLRCLSCSSRAEFFLSFLDVISAITEVADLIPLPHSLSLFS